MEVPWMQPFFSFTKVWCALPMAGAQEAGHRRLQRIALFRGLGDNASASWSACRYQGVRFASVAQPMAVLLMTGTCSVTRDVFWFCGMCQSSRSPAAGGWVAHAGKFGTSVRSEKCPRDC